MIVTVQSDSSCATYLEGGLGQGGGRHRESNGGREGGRDGGTEVNSVGFQGGLPILDT